MNSSLHPVRSQEEPAHELCKKSAQHLSEVPHIDDGCRYPGICILSTKDEKGMHDSLSSHEVLLLNEWCSSFHDQDYIEKIKQFLIYVDKVKRITRPGCSPETLNVALSSMSSLSETLSAISSKQCRLHASL